MVLVSFSMLVLCKPWFYSTWVVMTCVNSWGSAKIAKGPEQAALSFSGPGFSLTPSPVLSFCREQLQAGLMRAVNFPLLAAQRVIQEVVER